MRTRFAGLTLLAVAFAGSTLLAGCGSDFSSIGSGPAAGVALRGSVHGGQQPVSGAHVYLLAANTTGYGNASASLLTLGTVGTDSIGKYVLSDTNGNFSITGDYSCTSGQQVYLLVTQGNPGLSGSQTNPNLALLSVLGACPALGTFLGQYPFVQVNEVTTVAGVYALSGFMTDASHVSSSGTMQALLGTSNAFANAANLASVSNGTALSSANGGSISVPQPEINTLADILASCVNSAGAGSPACTTLFTKAIDGSTQPTDTVSAALNIVHHPAQNVASLYGLSSATAPFQPTLSAAPNDWTLALNITGGGLNQPGYVAVDAAGNVYATNINSTLSKVSPLGVPVSPSTGYQNLGNYLSALSIDLQGNIWIVNGANSQTMPVPSNVVSEVSPAGIPVTGSPFSAGGINFPESVAADGAGNLWIGNQKGSRLSGLNTTSGVTVAATGYADGTPASSVAVDSAGYIWTASGSNNTLYRVSSTGVPATGSPYTLPSSGANNGFNNLAIDAQGDVWVTGYTSLLEISPAGGQVSGSPFSGGGQCSSCLTAIAIDGANNVWESLTDFLQSYDNGSSGLAEFSHAGAPLSPSTKFQSASLVAPIGVAIDPSGNVWAADNGATMVEFVGAGAPTVTPLALAIKNGSLGTRP